MTNISTQAARAKLKPRKEPYWSRLKQGVFIGYSKQHESWHLRVRGTDGKQRYFPLGGFEQVPEGNRYDAAVRACEQHVGPMQNGSTDDHTVSDAIESYLAAKHADVLASKGEAAAKRARADAVSKLSHVSESVRAMKLSHLTKPWLESWRNDLYTRTDEPMKAQSARRVYSVFRAVLARAWQDGATSANGFARLKGLKAPVAKREYFPTRKEVGAILKAASPEVRNWLTCLRLTGMRPTEPWSITAADFHAEAATVDVRVSKTGPRTVYLQPDAVAFFKRLAKGKAGDALLFTRADGSAWTDGTEHRPFVAARDKSKVPAAFVAYSLRHYFISQALLAGVNAQVIAENTGTSVRMIEMNYGKFRADDRAAMLAKVKL
jgi:integrase